MKRTGIQETRYKKQESRKKIDIHMTGDYKRQ